VNVNGERTSSMARKQHPVFTALAVAAIAACIAFAFFERSKPDSASVVKGSLDAQSNLSRAEPEAAGAVRVTDSLGEALALPFGLDRGPSLGDSDVVACRADRNRRYCNLNGQRTHQQQAHQLAVSK
jgi:hypothetical protein